jgi:hypothetical protein
VWYNEVVNSKLKTLLKVTAIAVVPGLGVLWLARTILRDLNDRQEFRAYIRKTYGKDSKYVDHYQ